MASENSYQSDNEESVLYYEYIDIEENASNPDLEDNVSYVNVQERANEKTIRMVLKTRRFLNERNSVDLGQIEMVFNTIPQFEQRLWEKVEPHIKRGITFNEESNEYVWVEEELAPIPLGEFVIYQDKSNRKSCDHYQINENKLTTWSKKRENIICYIQVYSNRIQTKTQFDKAKKQLLDPNEADRAGASSNAEVAELANKLKEIHSERLSAIDMTWFRWANYIKGSEAHQREALMNDLPPANLIQLFSQVREDPVQNLNHVRRGIIIGQRVNEGIVTALEALNEDIKKVIESFETGLRFAKDIKRRLEALEVQTQTNDNLLDGMRDAVGPELTEFGRSLLTQIEESTDD